MINEIYTLFKESLPDIIRSENTVKYILEDKDCHVFDYSVDDKIVGAAVICDNAIYLLCVSELHRNKGIGTQLLKQSESYIISNGYKKVVLGAGKDYIMPGVPMNNGAHEFFKKHGYVHSWGDCGCYDMWQNLNDFTYNEHKVGDTIDGITYRWATLNDLDSIIECVSNAALDFVQYYDNKNLYEEKNQSFVLVAQIDKKIAGTLIISAETEGKGIGSVGCTATSPQYRKRGIAANMVILGTRYLKEIGLNKAWLGYTYTDIVKLYNKAGYKICMEYFMGEKVIEN